MNLMIFPFNTPNYSCDNKGQNHSPLNQRLAHPYWKWLWTTPGKLLIGIRVYNILWICLFIIMIIVVEYSMLGDVASTHVTTVPFRLSFTLSITTLDVSIEFSWVEVLEKVNMVELYSIGNVCTSAGPSAVILRRTNCLAIPVSSIREIFQSKSMPVTLQINCSWSPLHTEAILGGEIVTAPE